MFLFANLIKKWDKQQYLTYLFFPFYQVMVRDSLRNCIESSVFPLSDVVFSCLWAILLLLIGWQTYYYNLILYACYMQKCSSLSSLNAFAGCHIMCFCIICYVQTNQHVTFCFEILICIKLLQNILVVWKIITNFTLRNITSWQNAIAWRVIYGISSWLTPYIIWSNA